LSIKDTTVFGQVVIIDSTVLKAVVGLPTGITYQCLTNNCVFLPSKPSCVNFSGTPTQAGNFPLKMAVMIYAKIGGAIPYNRSDTLRTFSIKVNGINSSEDLENNSQFSVSPNPVENELVVFLAPYSFSKSLWITDAMGRILMVESNNVEGEQIRINTSNLLPGVYFCSNGLISKRFIKL
jgi:hypothetical protein